jgi:hypothetical protein
MRFSDLAKRAERPAGASDHPDLSRPRQHRREGASQAPGRLGTASRSGWFSNREMARECVKPIPRTFGAFGA